ncbi:MAG: TrkA C-terminal domain-containing protein [Phycisphaerales bacterium]|nr:TrkA C-terminal domain-containing protein [Phycisphaerales bacterium]
MAIIAVFIIAGLALIVVRIGATALMMTGLSRSVAEFQAISCFFGVGFTTNEAEMIVSHPARRKIAQHLIISGNIGLTGALSAVIVSFVDTDTGWIDQFFHADHPASLFTRIVVMLVGILLIAAVFRLGIIKRILEAIIKNTLVRVHAIRPMDYETVLRSSAGYAVIQIELEAGNPLIGRTLAGAQLGTRGVLVLGIQRSNDEYIGTPHATTEFRAGDILTVYGQENSIIDAAGLGSETEGSKE